MRERFDYYFDLAVYRLTAVKKATYRFTGHFFVEIEVISDSKVHICLSPRTANAVSILNPDALQNEVLDQELRESVADETKSVRELLLAQAFSGLALVDPVGESADYRDDPLGITLPSHKADDTAKE